jgi:hypothetical protein
MKIIIRMGTIWHPKRIYFWNKFFKPIVMCIIIYNVYAVIVCDLIIMIIIVIILCNIVTCLMSFVIEDRCIYNSKLKYLMIN